MERKLPNGKETETKKKNRFKIRGEDTPKKEKLICRKKNNRKKQTTVRLYSCRVLENELWFYFQNFHAKLFSTTYQRTHRNR